MIICSELFNSRIGNFVIFKPHVDNIPEFPRLYTFSMLLSHKYQPTGRPNRRGVAYDAQTGVAAWGA